MFLLNLNLLLLNQIVSSRSILSTTKFGIGLQRQLRLTSNRILGLKGIERLSNFLTVKRVYSKMVERFVSELLAKGHFPSIFQPKTPF